MIAATSGVGVAILVVVVASPCRVCAQANAQEQEYYSWCRSQGGTPSGSLSTLHCIPPSSMGGGGFANGGGMYSSDPTLNAIGANLSNSISNAIINIGRPSPAELRRRAQEEQIRKFKAKERKFKREQEERQAAQAWEKELDHKKDELLGEMKSVDGGGGAGQSGSGSERGLKDIDSVPQGKATLLREGKTAQSPGRTVNPDDWALQMSVAAYRFGLVKDEFDARREAKSDSSLRDKMKEHFFGEQAKEARARAEKYIDAAGGGDVMTHMKIAQEGSSIVNSFALDRLNAVKELLEAAPTAGSAEAEAIIAKAQTDAQKLDERGKNFLWAQFGGNPLDKLGTSARPDPIQGAKDLTHQILVEQPMNTLEDLLTAMLDRPNLKKDAEFSVPEHPDKPRITQILRR